MLRTRCMLVLRAHTKELETTWSCYLTNIPSRKARGRKKKMLFLAYSLLHPLQPELERGGSMS